MARVALGVLTVSLLASVTVAAPFFPVIQYDDFGVLTSPLSTTYNFNAGQADELVFSSLISDNNFAHNVYTYTNDLISSPALPVYNIYDGGFGGTLYGNILFDGSDGPFVGPGGQIDVSLTGTSGLLTLTGAIGSPNGNPSGILLQIEVTKASLYGLGGVPSLNIEAIGTITQSALGDNLIGQTGVITGSIFRMSLPSGYSPDDIVATTGAAKVAFSGEVGRVPEPAMCLMALAGAALSMAVRRQRNR